MNQKNLVAVDVFDQVKEPTTPSEETEKQTQQPESEENGPGTNSTPTGENSTQTSQDTTSVTEKTNDIPTYFIYGGVIVGLVILLALLIIIRKIYKK